MSYELKAIIEYDAARLEIKSLAKQISDSTAVYNDVGFFKAKKCTRSDDKQCFELLWDWNAKNLAYESHTCGWGSGDDDDCCPEPPDGEEPTALCDYCKVTQQLVDDRKAARKRFGIAKTRLSRIARDYRNSTELHVDELWSAK